MQAVAQAKTVGDEGKMMVLTTRVRAILPSGVVCERMESRALRNFWIESINISTSRRLSPMKESFLWMTRTRKKTPQKTPMGLVNPTTTKKVTIRMEEKRNIPNQQHLITSVLNKIDMS